MPHSKRDIIRQRTDSIAIALSLSGGVSWSVDTDFDGGDFATRIKGTRDQVLFLNWGNGPALSRVAISGSYPSRSNGAHVHSQSYQITAAADKDPARIAADIRRRLLPDYRAELAQVQLRIHDADSDEVGRHELAAELARLCKGEVRDSGTRSYVSFTVPGIGPHGDSGEFEVFGPVSAELKIRATSTDTLRSLAAMLGKLQP